MALTIGALEVILRSDVDSFTSSMTRAAGAVDASSARMSRAVQGTDRSITGLERSLSRFSGARAFDALAVSALRAETSVKRLEAVAASVPAAIGGLGSSLAIRGLQQYADGATQVRNRIATVVDQTNERAQAEQAVFDIAQRTRSQYGATAQLFARTSLAAQQLGRSRSDVLQFVEAIQKTNQISGSTTQESASAAIQLAQGLASNRLQGDELRSILENNVTLANILAQELAGGNVGRLREMGTEGLLTAQAVIDAVLRRQEDIQRQFARSQPTIAAGFQVIDNALTKYVGDLDAGVGASKALFDVMNSIAANVPSWIGALGALAAATAGTFAGRAVGNAVGNARERAAEVNQRRLDAAKEAQFAREQASREAALAALRTAGAAEAARQVDQRGTLATADTRAVQTLTGAANDLARARSRLVEVDRRLVAVEGERARIEGAQVGPSRGLVRRAEQAESAEKRALERAEEMRRRRDALPDVDATQARVGNQTLGRFYSAAFDVTAAQAKYDQAGKALNAFVATNRTAMDELAYVSRRAQRLGDQEALAIYGPKREALAGQIRALRQERDAAGYELQGAEQRFRAQQAGLDAADLTAKERVAAQRIAIDQRIAQAESQAATARQRATVAQSAISDQAARANETRLQRLQSIVDEASRLRTERVFAERGVEAAGGRYNEARGAVETSATQARTQASSALTAAVSAEGAAQRALAEATTRASVATEAASARSRAFAGVLGVLSGAGSSLVGFLGGPWGVAFAVASGALALFAMRQAEAASEAQKHKAALEGMPELLARVEAARAKTASGQNASRDVVDVRTGVVQATAAAKAEADRFFDEIVRLGGTNMAAFRAVIEDGFRFRIQPNETTITVMERIRREGGLTADAMGRVKGVLEGLGASARLDPSLASSLADAAGRAQSATTALERLQAKVGELDGAQATIRINLVGMDLSGARTAEGAEAAIQAATEGARREAEQVQAGVEATMRQMSQRAALQRSLSTADGKKAPRADRVAERARSLREQFPNLPQGELERAAGKFIDSEGTGGRKRGASQAEKDEKAYARTLRELREEATSTAGRFSDLDKETIRYARSAKIAEADVAAFMAAVADGRLDQVPEKIRPIRAELERIQAARVGDQLRDAYMGAPRQYQNFLKQLAASDIQDVQERARIVEEAQKRIFSGDAADQMTSAFSDAVKSLATSASSIEDVFKTLSSRVTNIILSELLKPAEDALRQLLRSLMGGLNGNGQGQGGIVGMLFQGIGATAGPLGLSGGGAVATSVTSSGFVDASTAFGLYHVGGTAGAPRDIRIAPSSLLSGAPRYHNGLRAGEMAAILERGETVLTQKMAQRSANTMNGLAAVANDNGGGGGVVVNNYASDDVRVTPTRGPDGRFIIEVAKQVDRIQAGMHAAGRSEAMRAAGIRQPLRN